MDDNTRFYWRLVFGGSALVATAMLTAIYGMYILIAAGIIGALATTNYLILPMRRKMLENDRIKAETYQIDVSSEATRARFIAEMADFYANLQRFPDAYRVTPDDHGYYPQFVDELGKFAGYIPGPNKGGQRLLAAPARDEIPEDEYYDGGDQMEPATRYDLGDLLARITRDDQYLIGIDEAGQLIYGDLFEQENNFFNSISAFGDQNSGKSTAAVYFAALTVLAAGRLLVIDPDAEIRPQSLAARLGPLCRQPFLMCSVGSDPLSAARVLEIAKQELEAPGNYPVLLLADEATLLFRQAENGGEWEDVGRDLADLAENYATRGRKRYRRVILLAQNPKAKRAGSTDLRESTDLLIFKMKKKRARLALQGEPELADLATTVQPGQCVAIPARSSDEPFLLQLPYPDEASLRQVAAMAIKAIEEQAEEAITEAPRDLTPELKQRLFMARVKELRDQNKNVSEIVKIIFNVTRGGSPAWSESRDKVQDALKEIEQAEQARVYRQVEGGRY